MSGDKHGLAALQLGYDIGLPVRRDARDDILQRLGFRHRDARVARVVVLRELVVRVDVRRRRGIGAAPDHELLVPVLAVDVGFVASLQRSVVTLVQTPGSFHRNPQTVCLVQRVEGRANGAAQQRCEDNVGQDVLLLHQPAAVLRLFDPLRGQRHVYPAGELIRFVPRALAMPEQNQGICHSPDSKRRRRRRRRENSVWTTRGCIRRMTSSDDDP